jgi:glycosyltransferase involved in cell wall biosynthesis
VERSEGRVPDGEPELVALTPTFREARPRVSVAITLHNYEREVLEALASVEASEFDDYELLVIDDASTDRSLDVVRDFLAERPWLPGMLFRHPLNRGLAASRNALARRARGEMMFVLDADNAIYPTALGRLVEALDRDPGASFAYPLIAMHRSGETIGLLSRYAWDPDGFRNGNYIDAMALIRLDDFWALGGYTEDPRLTAWEDFHFWCACAESGRRGRLVPEVLATYRKADHSMLSWTQTDATAAWSVMHTRFPALLPATPA